MALYPLAIYTAHQGLDWTYPRSEIGFAEIDACRKVWGNLPDFDAGEVGYAGIWVTPTRVFIIVCQSVHAWDFRGRDATYLAVTWLSREEAKSINFETVLHCPALMQPSKTPKTFFELEARGGECLTGTMPQRFSQVGHWLATLPADSTATIQQSQNEVQLHCRIMKAPQQFRPHTPPADSATTMASYSTSNATLKQPPRIPLFMYIIGGIILFLLGYIYGQRSCEQRNHGEKLISRQVGVSTNATTEIAEALPADKTSLNTATTEPLDSAKNIKDEKDKKVTPMPTHVD